MCKAGTGGEEWVFIVEFVLKMGLQRGNRLEEGVTRMIGMLMYELALCKCCAISNFGSRLYIFNSTIY